MGALFTKPMHFFAFSATNTAEYCDQHTLGFEMLPVVVIK